MANTCYVIVSVEVISTEDGTSIIETPVLVCGSFNEALEAKLRMMHAKKKKGTDVFVDSNLSVKIRTEDDTTIEFIIKEVPINTLYI